MAQERQTGRRQTGRRWSIASCRRVVFPGSFARRAPDAAPRSPPPWLAGRAADPPRIALVGAAGATCPDLAVPRLPGCAARQPAPLPPPCPPGVGAIAAATRHAEPALPSRRRARGMAARRQVLPAATEAEAPAPSESAAVMPALPTAALQVGAARMAHSHEALDPPQAPSGARIASSPAAREWAQASPGARIAPSPAARTLMPPVATIALSPVVPLPPVAMIVAARPAAASIAHA